MSLACIFAWNYPVFNISRSEFRMCCRSFSNKVTNEDLEKENTFVNFNKIIEMRKDLLKNIQTKLCGACWELENKNIISSRAPYTDFLLFLQIHYFKNLTIDEIEKKCKNLTEIEIDEIAHLNIPNMLEISISNTCDLKCVYCHHHYSSQWAAERLKYNEISDETYLDELPTLDENFENKFWEYYEENSKYLNYINFIGGEPLIIDKFYKYFEKINNKEKNKIISVVTNLNTKEKYFEKFKKIISNTNNIIDINISMESVNERAEYIRSNLNWNKFNKNLNDLLQFIIDNNLKDKIIINFQIATNALSISSLPRFLNYIVKLELKYDIPLHLRQNQVSYPKHLNPYILTSDYVIYINKAIEILEQFKHKNDGLRKDRPYGLWNNYIYFLKKIKKGLLNNSEQNENRKEFVIFIEQMRERRNLDFEKTFPEMVQFYNHCKEFYNG